jgi:hypothetical protein
MVRMGYDAPTAPLPYGAAGDPGRDNQYDLEDPDDWPRPRRRRWRVLRRIAAVILALVVLCGAAFGVLLLITPSVNNAPALARAIDRAHHAAYPGPPVPLLFAESLVATEDHRFYSEPGVDVFAVARVAAATVSGHGDQGGATLYQQLAKMLYTPGKSGVRAEIEQVMLGIKLDLSYSKAQILRMYADVAYSATGTTAWPLPAAATSAPPRPGSPCLRRPPWPAWCRARQPTTRSPTTRGPGAGRHTC